VITSCTYHLNIYCTHFQSLKLHHCTSVVNVIVKCIFSVALSKGCHKVVAQRKSTLFMCPECPFCVVDESKCMIMFKSFFYSASSH